MEKYLGEELLPSEGGKNPSSKPHIIQVGSWCAKERQSSNFIQITQLSKKCQMHRAGKVKENITNIYSALAGICIL